MVEDFLLAVQRRDDLRSLRRDYRHRNRIRLRNGEVPPRRRYVRLLLGRRLARRNHYPRRRNNQRDYRYGTGNQGSVLARRA